VDRVVVALHQGPEVLVQAAKALTGVMEVVVLITQAAGEAVHLKAGMPLKDPSQVKVATAFLAQLLGQVLLTQAAGEAEPPPAQEVQEALGAAARAQMVQGHLLAELLIQAVAAVAGVSRKSPATAAPASSSSATESHNSGRPRSVPVLWS